MLKIQCLGGFREVGRNAVLLEGSGTRILMDYGYKVESSESPLPCHRPDALVLAHPHLDHSGSVPTLYKGKKFPAFATAACLDQAMLLLKDHIKISSLKDLELGFGKSEVSSFARSSYALRFGERFKVGRASCKLINAGHVPGSAMILVEISGKRILYTSDFNTIPTRLLTGASTEEIGNVDTVIMESTYSNRDHTPRQKSEYELFRIIKNTIDNGGVALIPAFAVGRSAEVLATLASFKPHFPVYIDGMAREATEILTHHPNIIRNPHALDAALDLAVPLYSDDERADAVSRPCAIITTGGTLDGGPVVSYIKRLYTRPECSLIFVGFQPPKTAGRYLLDTGRFVSSEFDLAIKMSVHTIDFSAHAGRTQLLNFVKKLKPAQVLCMHGDHCERFATELRSRFGVDATAPKNGEVVIIH